MMSLLVLVLALVMLAQLQAVSLKSISGGAKWASSAGSAGSSAARPAPIKNTAVPFKTSSVAPTVASKKSSAGKKDMTWGGRPGN